MSIVKNIKNLGSGKWRLDIVGNIEPNHEKIGGEYFADPILYVYFSRLEDDYSSKKIFHNKNIKKEQYKVLLGVGALPLLRCGSIWENGVPDFKAHTVIEDVSLEINTETTEIVNSKSFFNPKLNNFYQLKNVCDLNFMEVDCTRTNKEFKNVFIPMPELVRFYYAYTSKLASIVFSTKINDLNLFFNWDKTGCYQKDEKKFFSLHVRKEISDIEAKPFLRVAVAGKEYKKSPAYINMIRISHIYPRLESSFCDTRNTISIESGFPFTGKTTLRARGKRIKSTKGWCFLALELVSCSAKFPFDHLQIERDNDNRKGIYDDKNISKPSAYMGANQSRCSKNDANPTITYEEDPSKDLSEIDTLLRDAPLPHFSDLDEKEISRERKFESTYASHTNKSDNTTSTTATTGIRRSGTSTPLANIKPRPVSEIVPTKSDIPLHFYHIEKALHILSAKKEVTQYQYHRIGNNNSTEDNSPSRNCAYFPAEYNEKKLKWSFIGQRSRRAIIAEINSGSYYFYLLEVEKSKKEQRFSTIVFYKENLEPITSDYLEDYIAHLSDTKMEFYRITFEQTFLLNIKIFYHPSKTSNDDVSKKIAEKLYTFITKHVKIQV